MLIFHSESDDAILDAWTYFREWRHSRNALLLFDALSRLNAAERAWIKSHGWREPLRRDWQVLRRCVSIALSRVGDRLINARTPAATERALHATGKRATLARDDQLNNLAIVTALTGTTIDGALAILRSWGKGRSRGYLVKRASQFGLTPRKTVRSSTPSKVKRVSFSSPISSSILEISPGRRRVSGRSY